MAKKPTLKERSIRFYEIVQVIDGEQKRIEQLDFPSALLKLSTAPLDKRRVTADTVLIGTPRNVDETEHLLLHRVKDQGEWLAVINFTTGVWKELESRASEGYLDTTAICFLEYGNIVGIMQGATSAPSHKALESWLNGLKIFGQAVFAVRPLMTRAQVDRLKIANGASRIELQFGTEHASQLANKKGRLAQIISRTMEEYGDARITVIISIPPGGKRGEQRQALRNDLSDLSDVMPEGAKVAKATLVYAEANGDEYRQVAEFIEHHITAKRRVPAVDEKGNSIKLSEALRIIAYVAIENEDELRSAADAEKK